MNVFKSMLHSKPVPGNLDMQDWPEIDRRMMNAFITKNGIHTNEYDNYDSYLDDIIELVKEHVKITFLDDKDNLHHIHIPDCYFIKPYERQFGIDNPEQALLRNHYEATVRGTAVYTIHRKPDRPETVADDPSDMLDSSADEDEGDEGDGQEYVEEHDEGDDDDVDEDDEIEEDDVEEDEDEEDEDDDDIGEKSASSKKSPKLSFSFHHDVHAEYTELIHRTVKDNHYIQDFPVLLWTRLCNMRGPYMIPSVYFKPYLQVPTYCVNRNFKLCPNEEYFVNNRILLHGPGRVEPSWEVFILCKRRVAQILR